MHVVSEKKNLKELHEITVNSNTTKLNQEALPVIDESQKRIKWTEGLKNFPEGFLSF